jgi:hypothetical protein
VHAPRTGRERHVHAIVDHDSGARAFDRADDFARQRQEMAVVETALPDLNEVYAGRGGIPNDVNELIAVAGAFPASSSLGSVTVRNEAEDRPREPGLHCDGRVGREGRFGVSRRAANAAPSSARPASSVTRPTPETAPRA